MVTAAIDDPDFGPRHRQKPPKDSVPRKRYQGRCIGERSSRIPDHVSITGLALRPDQQPRIRGHGSWAGLFNTLG
jgi:hypothetical protein